MVGDLVHPLNVLEFESLLCEVQLAEWMVIRLQSEKVCYLPKRWKKVAMVVEEEEVLWWTPIMGEVVVAFFFSHSSLIPIEEEEVEAISELWASLKY